LILENQKQIYVIAGALAAGLLAVVLTSNYINNAIQGQTKALAEQYERKQAEMASEIQQRSDQQMAALAQELERVKTDQAEETKKQIEAVQKADRDAEEARERALARLRKPSLALETPVGKRAVTVMIESLSAVGGLINAGDFVDVIAQLNVPSQDPDKKTVTAMIFQDLQVLAINTNLNDPGAYDEQQASSLKITFAVDPQEAGLLSFANKNGTLELALRSPKEGKRPPVKASTWKTLADYVMRNQGYDIENPDGTPEAKVEEKPSIQIFRAGKEL